MYAFRSGFNVERCLLILVTTLGAVSCDRLSEPPIGDPSSSPRPLEVKFVFPDTGETQRRELTIAWSRGVLTRSFTGPGPHWVRIFPGDYDFFLGTERVDPFHGEFGDYIRKEEVEVHSSSSTFLLTYPSRGSLAFHSAAGVRQNSPFVLTAMDKFWAEPWEGSKIMDHWFLPGRYLLRVDSGGETPFSMVVKVESGKETLVEVPEDCCPSNPVPLASKHGTVLRPTRAWFTTMADVRFLAWNPLSPHHHWDYPDHRDYPEVEIDPSGQVELGGLPAGRYSLRFQTEGELVDRFWEVDFSLPLESDESRLGARASGVHW